MIVIAIDTNLLIFAHRASAGLHPGALRALRRAVRDREGWGFPLPVVSEFWRVVTNPQLPGGASTFSDAEAFLNSMYEAGASCWLPVAGVERRLADMAKQMKISGPRIFDLQIALIAREAGARQIWTHDRKFATVQGVKLLDPFGE